MILKKLIVLDQGGELMVSIIQQTYPWEITFSDSSGVLQNLNILIQTQSHFHL